MCYYEKILVNMNCYRLYAPDIILGGLVLYNSSINGLTFDDAIDFFKDNVGALAIIDGKADFFKTVVRKGIFKDIIGETGSYHDLIEKLWFHFNKSSASVIEDYHVFIPAAGTFTGKYSRRVNISVMNVFHTIQMTIYPLKEKDMYLFILDELDDNQSLDEIMTDRKINTIQNTYLFSMYIDLEKDSISSISITEMSDEVINQHLKYSEWRMMIVNMINADDQALFLERSSPEYLKAHFAPGRTSSFDCLMKNLEGKYIWVKLIFSRTETNNPDDYRFVYMVQDIHENAEELMSTLKKYEDLASKDSLTSLYNHGRIETEISNAITECGKTECSISVMMLDIDYFKQINDTFGHAAGDSALKYFTNIITDYVKDMNSFVGRWGGEEFVVVCYDTDKDKAASAAEGLRQKVEAAKIPQIGCITCSIGVTSIEAEDTTVSAFERVDRALYDAKENGRNCIKAI